MVEYWWSSGCLMTDLWLYWYRCYSYAALLSGLVIKQNPKFSVKKWITLAGVLNHTKWTRSLRLPSLQDSINLKTLPIVPQRHFIGDKDRTVSYKLIESLVDEKNLVIISGATHDKGYTDYLF